MGANSRGARICNNESQGGVVIEGGSLFEDLRYASVAISISCLLIPKTNLI